MINKQDLINKLKSEIVTVTFTKTNGETRIMPCTLQDEFIIEKPKGIKKENSDIVSVWCIDKEAWRSFRVDSVKSYKTKNEIVIANIEGVK